MMINEGLKKFELKKRIKRVIATNFRNWATWLYSTVDNPIEVPVQIEAYKISEKKYLCNGDRILDVGSGLGYGIKILSQKADSLYGIDIDSRAIKYSIKETSLISKKTCL